MLLFVFIALYFSGEGPCTFDYSAQAFSLSHRKIGISWPIAINDVWANLLSLTSPQTLQSFEAQGSFGSYAALNFMALILIFSLLQETKERTLEEFGVVFAVPAHQHINYQRGTILPCWCNGWLLFSKSSMCPN